MIGNDDQSIITHKPFIDGYWHSNLGEALYKRKKTMKASYTLEPGQYLTHTYAHSHITRAVAAVDSYFGLNLLGLISMAHPSGRK